MRNRAPKRSGKFLLTPRFDPVPLSLEDLGAVTEIIRAVGPKVKLSKKDRARLWGALLASKRSLRKFSTVKKYRGSSADLKLLQMIKVRSGEAARLLQEYTSKKALAVPESRADGPAFYAAVLREIQDAAERSMAREKTFAGFQPPETLQESYAGGLLAMIFETIFKRDATATIIPSTGKPGPFIKFVQLAHEKLGLAVPPAASIRTWRRRYQQKQEARQNSAAPNDDGPSTS